MTSVKSQEHRWLGLLKPVPSLLRSYSFPKVLFSAEGDGVKEFRIEVLS